jgi:hypothetical protein
MQFMGVECAPAAPAAREELPPHAAPSRYDAATSGEVLVSIPLARFLSREYGRAAREMTPLSLARIRVEPAGPATPVERIVVALESALQRPADIVVRSGDYDFLAVMPDTHAKGAEILAERIKALVEETGAVRVRVGVASAVPQSDGSVDELLADAEHALANTPDEGITDSAIA